MFCVITCHDISMFVSSWNPTPRYVDIEKPVLSILPTDPSISSVLPMGHPTIFLLGATGYIGSDFLVQLGKTLPHLPVYALVRTPSSERRTWLSAAHPNLTVVEGTLDSVEVIERQAENADIVINIASCDHVPSSRGVCRVHSPI